MVENQVAVLAVDEPKCFLQLSEFPDQQHDQFAFPGLMFVNQNLGCFKRL